MTVCNSKDLRWIPFVNIQLSSCKSHTKKSEVQDILEDKKGKILERTGEMEEKILSQNVLQPLISEATIIQVQLNTQLSWRKIIIIPLETLNCKSFNDLQAWLETLVENTKIKWKPKQYMVWTRGLHLILKSDRTGERPQWRLTFRQPEL